MTCYSHKISGRSIVIRLFSIIVLALAINAQEVNIQILTTTNIHGRILPQDSYTLQPTNQGWAKLGTIIRNLKSANPNTIIIDCGNTIQGEPINYVWSHLSRSSPEPSMAIMNSLKYSAMLVGSSELCYGLKQLRTIEGQAKFPWLAANIVSTCDGHKIFTPYTLVNAGGIRVAILGLTATKQPILINSNTSEGIAFQDPLAVSKNIIPMLREKEGADMVVLAINGEPGHSVKSLESIINDITTQVTNIDLILVSHTNQKISQKINNVPILQASPLGAAIGVGKFSFYKKNSGEWEKRLHQSSVITVGSETGLDSAVMELTSSLRAKTETYLNTFATNLNTNIDSRWSRMENTAIMQLMHSVAKRASSSDITAIITPGAKIFIPKGPTSVRQFYSLFPNDYYLVRIRITGRQLRAYLEHSAHFYTFSHHPELFNRDFGPENFDTLDGCSYSLDISKPLGLRVVELKVHGQPLKDTQNLTMCLCSNRMSGAGGYLEAMDWSGQPEFISLVPFRNLILEHVLSQPSITVNVTNHWRIIPALDRERVSIQQP